MCQAAVSFPVRFTEAAGEPLYSATKDKCVAPGDRIAINDHLETTMTVPGSGAFTWHVNPSTRPFKRYRYVPNAGEQSIGTESFAPREGEAPQPYAAEQDQLPREDWDFIRESVPGGDQLPEMPAQPGSVPEPQPKHYVEREFTIPDDGAQRATVSLDWTAPAPEDYDLYLWKKAADGTWQPAGNGTDGTIWAGSGPGTSGHPPGDFEQIEITENIPGEYRMRIVNYAAAGDTWTVEVERFAGGTGPSYEEVGRENWTLTCESADGQTVYETHEVFVDRGQSVAMNMPCGGSTKKPKKPKPPRNPNG